MNTISSSVLAAALALTGFAAHSQSNLPATEPGPIVFSTQTLNLSDNKGVSLEVPTKYRYEYAVSGTKWLVPEIQDGKLILNAEENTTSGARKAVLSIRSRGGVVSEFTVVQPGWNIADLAESTVDDRLVIPVRAVDACKNSLGQANSASEGIEKSYDGKTSTFYHSNWNGFDSAVPSQHPVLEYYFTAADAPADETVEIESITYVPRADGGTNGNFGLIDVEVGTLGPDGNIVWTKISGSSIDLKMSSNPSLIQIPENMRKGIRAIRVTVHSGSSDNGNGKNFASCAEMQFNKPVSSDSSTSIFSDEMLTSLRDGVTREEIEAEPDPFKRELALAMLDGSYSSEGRISSHKPIKDVSDLSAEWNAPGKFYDRTQGVTGVVMSKGKYVVVVSGISDAKGIAQLKIVYWNGHAPYTDSSSGNEVKYYVHDQSFNIRNGINIIDVTGDEAGLAYISNFDTSGLASGTASEIKVHIIGADVNGVLRPTLTNAEMDRILDNAVYPCIDLLGSRVHSVWEVQALKTNTKGQYVRYMNLLDQLIMWEHRLLGFEKYGRVPENTTLAYVNYDYYMYQGGRGVTFKYDTQNRVCNPDKLMFNDDDAIWGLSHEWGHQHQMTPYFMWAGMAEVTNNVFSAYNVSHMGYKVNDPNYKGRYPSNKWKVKAPRIFLDDNYTVSADGLTFDCRSNAKAAAEAGNISFTYNDEIKEFAINQPLTPTRRSDNPKTAINAIEAYSSSNGELILAPYVALQYYFSENQPGRAPEDYRPDLWPDLFEAMRQSDDPQGSQIEKKGEADKYELLLSIFNNNKNNKKAEFQSRFPQSVWNTHKYIPESIDLTWNNNSVPAIMNFIRKMSRLTGYNLWPYFERWGVITVAAIEKGDYGTKHYIMTEAMYDEFKADMFELETSGELRPLSDEMINKISYCEYPSFDAPNIPNERPLLPTDN